MILSICIFSHKKVLYLSIQSWFSRAFVCFIMKNNCIILPDYVPNAVLFSTLRKTYKTYLKLNFCVKALIIHFSLSKNLGEKFLATSTTEAGIIKLCNWDFILWSKILIISSLMKFFISMILEKEVLVPLL
jgi:hypothetical protein